MSFSILIQGVVRSKGYHTWNASLTRHAITESGRGPAWWVPRYVSPFKMQFEKLSTVRLMSFLTPSYDLDAYAPIRYLLHNTRLGRVCLRTLSRGIHRDLITQGRFDACKQSKKLVPPAIVFWSGTSIGIFSHVRDVLDVFREGSVDVHTADIASLSAKKVHLSDGKEIEADVVVCATGWNFAPSMSFSPPSIVDQIGMIKSDPNDERVKEADKEILNRFPELKDQPPAGPIGVKEREQTSFHLHRNAIPPAFLESRNLAYSGAAISLRGMMVMEVQALWTIAFLDGKVKTPALQEAEWEALLQSRFWRYRTPQGLGARCSDLVFEIMPFLDTLMRDLRLEPHRKGGWRELVECYTSADYRGVVDEWLEKQRAVGDVGDRKANGKSA